MGRLMRRRDDHITGLVYGTDKKRRKCPDSTKKRDYERMAPGAGSHPEGKERCPFEE